jgi:PBP1b-binding outer membrane lipoprotein LpoB
MRRWLMLAALALFVCGCKSISHPAREKQEEPKEQISVPNGEASPFN